MNDGDRKPLHYPVICQLCGELLPDLNPMPHLARHVSGELKTLSIGEAYTRGVASIETFHGRRSLLNVLSRRALELRLLEPFNLPEGGL